LDESQERTNFKRDVYWTGNAIRYDTTGCSIRWGLIRKRYRGDF
jgi:hypothetical protein